jgi:hypothetical protein
MSSYTSAPSGQSSPPNGGAEGCQPTGPTGEPADQPHAPSTKECEDPKDNTPPKPGDLKCCTRQCTCPPVSRSDPNCIETLIGSQTMEITKAEKAKTFKTDLEALLTKAKAASLEYNRDKYDKLLKEWLKQDREIAELIRKLVCALPCWRCVIDCHVCPLLEEIHYSEQRLYGDGKLYAEVHNLHDLLYWHERDLAAKTGKFNRVKAVLAAWEQPAQAIEKVLADNAKLIVDVGKVLGAEPGKVLVDVFFKMVPMHLAIAPPRTDTTTTTIDKKFTQFCDCEKGDPEMCCGPNVGDLTVRERITGPQPYLVDPNDYFPIICCLVSHRYRWAKEYMATAEANYENVKNQIASQEKNITDRFKSFDKDARTAIPSVIDCCNYRAASTDTPAPAPTPTPTPTPYAAR